MISIFKKLSLISFFLYSLAILAIYIDGRNSYLFLADYAVVLGNKIELDGTPSKRLQARLDAAVQLNVKQRIGKVIVSGGVGKEGFDEAVVMARYLQSHGVSSEDILIDSNGYNTKMTAANAANLIDSSSSIVAISQRFHLSRSKMALRNAGFTEVYGYHADYHELRDIYAYVREVPAWLKYWFVGLRNSVG